MKMAEIFRDVSGGGQRKLGLGPGLEHSSRSKFRNREGCVTSQELYSLFLRHVSGLYYSKL